MVDSHGGVQDVRNIGRPDSELVLSGHGGIHIDEVGGHTTVPENTWLAMYSRHGEGISDSLGNAIERGDPGTVPVEIHGPGEKIPNYVLAPGHYGDPLNILGTPRTLTVNGITPLSDLLHPNMGVVHWVACRKTSFE